jgi:hypothetical protein
MDIRESLPGYDEQASKKVERSVFENLNKERLARGLGWFSIGLGIAGIMTPRTLARVLGTRNHGVLFRIIMKLSSTNGMTA